MKLEPVRVESPASPTHVPRTSRNAAPGPRCGPVETEPLAAGANPFSSTFSWEPTWDWFLTQAPPPPAVAQTSQRLPMGMRQATERRTGR